MPSIGSEKSALAIVAALVIAVALGTHSAAYANAETVTDADAVAETAHNSTFVEIRSLENHCEGNICRNFHFDNLTEVAFFDLKAEVRISEKSTYDLSSSLAYDTLIFENSTFANFPLHLFYALWVKELDMRHCAVEHLTWENFLMAGELRVLLLSDNRIEQINELTFNYATELQYLFLGANRIDSLVSESFKGLTQLKLLDLHNNRLKELPAGVFDYCVGLQDLNLSQNRLHVLTDDIFAQMPNLQTLQLQRNQLRDIGEYAFQKQRRLMLLDLSQNSRLEMLVNNLSVQHLVAANCSLQRINIYGNVNQVDLRDNRILELYFSQPQSLGSLNLRNNALQQIASLSRAHQLRNLDLGNNPQLGSLPDPWAVTSLERLDLSNTGLSELPITALGDKHQLRYLNISGNSIREINPRYFQYFEHLTNFQIHANDWNCFNLKMLLDLLIRPRKMYFARDTFDPEFPGEYIDGVACMYRLSDVDDPTLTLSENYIVMSEPQNTDPLAEVKKLRKELKAIVGFYEQKFSIAFDMITALKERLALFEKMNETLWQHMTITV